MRQQPEQPEKYSAMMKVFNNAESHEELKKLSLMYILDLSFSRADIALALHDIEVEKGWH